MKYTIQEVKTKQQLKAFIAFQNQLYKSNPYYVPSMMMDEIKTLDKQKNPAFDFCDAIYFLAYEGSKVVGRIAGLVNHNYNKITQTKTARFGFVDFIDDPLVSQLLFQTVEKWAKENHYTTIQGPLGFTDLDKEGLLIEGFDQLGTMSSLYNAPYYQGHIEKLGYKKEVDWIESKIFIPKEIPEKHVRIAEVVKRKLDLRIVKFKSGKELAKDYGQKIFDLINEAYAPLYGFTPLTQKQKDEYIKTYLPMLNLNFVTVIVNNENKLVGFGAAMPSMARALQKSKGKLFPFGFIHLLKALKAKKSRIADLLLVAVKPEYQNKGVNALLFTDLIPEFNKAGVEYAESNPELEMNLSVQAQWESFKTEHHKRRRAYCKQL